jgi:hypothetical protein
MQMTSPAQTGSFLQRHTDICGKYVKGATDLPKTVSGTKIKQKTKQNKMVTHMQVNVLEIKR